MINYCTKSAKRSLLSSLSCHAVSTFFSVPVIYFAITLRNTKPLNSINTITDGAAHQPVDSAELPDGAIPPIADIDLSVINKRIYLRDNR